MYKNKDVPNLGLSEAKFSALQQKLFSQGVKFTLARIDTTSSVTLDLKIDEIEFSRWLELMVQ